jgi:hypothetical protein
VGNCITSLWWVARWLLGCSPHRGDRLGVADCCNIRMPSLRLVSGSSCPSRGAESRASYSQRQFCAKRFPRVCYLQAFWPFSYYYTATQSTFFLNICGTVRKVCAYCHQHSQPDQTHCLGRLPPHSPSMSSIGPVATMSFYSYHYRSRSRLASPRQLSPSYKHHAASPL